MFDSTSIWIGVLIGVIITIIIFWLIIWSRSFVMSYCPSNLVSCVGTDYFQNPGDAIAEGADVNTILYIQNGVLYYKRVPSNTSCVPNSETQTVPIPYPEYCSFDVTSGVYAGNSYTGNNNEFNSPKYTFTLPDASIVTVLTAKNCAPVASNPSIVTSGTPVVKWDSSTNIN